MGVAVGLSVSSTASGAASLTVDLITWDVIGIDSNSPADGPHTFPVGVRVCNTGTSDADGVRADFVWDSSNGNIALEDQPYLEIGPLPKAACRDMFFNVVVQGFSGAFGATRAYHVEVDAEGVATASTSQPRELYVESLVSQQRNHVDAITGPQGTSPATTVHVGSTYTYELHGGTATNGYEQLEAFLDFPNAIFRVLSVDAVYTGPAGGTNDSVYADACGWDALPTSSTYHSCVGPEQFSGKAGGDIVITYRVLVVSTGVATVDGLIYDFSGSSFHYNADFGRDSITITSLIDQSTTTTAAPTTTPATTSTPTTIATPATVPTLFRGGETTLPTPTPDLPETGVSRSSLAICVAALLLVAIGIVLLRLSLGRP